MTSPDHLGCQMLLRVLMFHVADKSHTSALAKVKMGMVWKILCKKKRFVRCKENSKVILVFKLILKKLLSLFSLSNSRTSIHFASEHARRFQK